MTIERQPIQIELTPRFQRDLRTLGKRYRNIRNDIQPVIEQLQAGNFRAIAFREWSTKFSKSELKTATFKKAKVLATVLFITSKLAIRSFW